MLLVMRQTIAEVLAREEVSSPSAIGRLAATADSAFLAN
jgi:hypothetical protein